MNKQKGKRGKNAKQHPKIASAKHVFERHEYKDGDLTFEDFYMMSQENCFYCGVGPSNKWNKFLHRKAASKYAIHQGTFIYNGLDRVDSSLPHDKNNCVPCCKLCNYAKSTMSVQEFKSWVKRIYKHLFKK